MTQVQPSLLPATARRADAVARVREACSALDDIGVKARVIGSLAKGDFGPRSDVDLLVVECPRRLKYAIEGLVEDRLGALPFDLIYLDEVADHWKARLLQEAVNAGDIH